MNPPSLSAICLTFARNCHLEEAIASFNSQKCEWPIELLIYNTCPEQKLTLPPEFQRENIRIINCQTRPGSLGESRNLAIAAASGTHICTWDDDDLYLPNHLQNFIRHFADNDWCWMSAQFYSLGWQIKSITSGGQNVVAFTKAAWEQVGRYAGLNCGEDRDFVGRLTSKCKGAKIELQPGEISFIYSWDNACYHVSGAGDDAGQKNNAWKRAEHDFLTRVKLGKAKTGPITLQPHLKHDYQRMATEFVSKLSALNAPAASQNTPAPVQNAVSHVPEGAPTLYHAVERHQERISVNIARKQHAWTSWQRLYDREGVIPRHYWKYERSAKDIGDTLDLPYFKDVLKFGMEPASDNDIIVWTNDDTILHPTIVGVLRRHLAKYPVVMMARCEFRQRQPVTATPELWAKADRDRNHNGRDLMAFRKSWLTEHWDEIPDFLLGASEFDVFMTVFIRHFYGIATPRHSLNETKFPAELPRGHIGHIKHSTQWNTIRRYANAPAQKHNIRLYSENTSRYLKLAHNPTPAAITSQPVLDLPTVTIWACCWSEDADNLVRTIRVLRYCQTIIKCARYLLFSHLQPPALPGIDVIRISRLNGTGEWNTFVNKEVPKHIASGFAMSVHEDGFPLRTDLWDARFLDYDYIGAPWKDGVVGNGGFNIESQKLLRAKLSAPFEAPPGVASDYWVCRVHRKEFEQMGITFAPADLALHFSTETCGNDAPSFGFHGRQWSKDKYDKGWATILHREHSNSNSLSPATLFSPRNPCAPPRITIVYIHMPKDKSHIVDGENFVKSYQQYPPPYPHDTVVVCNGSPADEATKRRFASLPNVSYFNHDDSGWDIGAYIATSKVLNCDMMFCLGGSSFFRKPGWLQRISQAWQRHGPGFYGTNSAYNLRPHLNTNGFGCPPSILRNYPGPVVTREQRYDFEHGFNNAAWLLAEKQGYPVKLVTWDSEYDWPEWRSAPNIFHRGDQSNCLTYWHHHLKYEQASTTQKRQFELGSDTIPNPIFASKYPSVTMVYIYPVCEDDGRKYAERFVRSYMIFPPGAAHETVVICNGGPPNVSVQNLFRDIPCRFVEHDDSGWDIGAYQMICDYIKTDAVLCMGGPSTVRRAGWLRRLIDAWNECGRGLYGALGSFQYGIKHLATTGFLCPPTLIRQYPTRVVTWQDRAEFEHGPGCLTNLALHLGMKVKMVTWDGVWALDQMRTPKNVLSKGNQSNLLIYYKQTDIYDAANSSHRNTLLQRVNGTLAA